MGKIRILDDTTVNQIAAGEIILRPASVVKELLENAVDAGAAMIRIDLEQGGGALIRVTDNGEGMDREDALNALERHATSKISQIGDLAALDTRGFRGEALPSIASVSRMTITTGPPAADAGTEVRIEGGAVRRVADCASPRGTIIEVRDLFYNLPARRKSLRTPRTELGHSTTLVDTYALALPRVHFVLTHDGRTSRDFPAAGTAADRIYQVHGGAVADRLIRLDAERGGFRLGGFTSNLELTRRDAALQICFVNGRPVRDRTVSHAIRQVYQDLLPPGRHAVCFLLLDAPAALVDVNVHPAKSEIRFQNSGMVHAFIIDTLRRVLGAMETYPERAFGPLPGPSSTADRTFLPAGGHTRGQMTLAEPAGEWIGPAAAPGGEAADAAPAGAVGEPAPHGIRPIAQYRASFIVAESDEGLLLIDQHVAHERILYEELLAQYQASAVTSQYLLHPAPLDLPRHKAEVLRARRELLAALGFEIEPFGEESFLVKSLPATCGNLDPNPLLLEILDHPDREWDRDPVERALITAACHAAIKINTPLTREKMAFLVRRLFDTRNPFTCPHGRPIILRFTHDAIEKGFKRK